MHNACGVRGVERVGDLDRQRQSGLKLQGFSRDPGPQRRPIKKLHGNEDMAILLANFVDCADIRVIQRRRRLRFTPKAAQCLRVFGHVVRQKFKRHHPIETSVLRLENHPHAARTDVRLQFIRPELHARSERHGWSRL